MEFATSTSKAKAKATAADTGMRTASVTKGMVTSPHKLASEAGLEVLRNGGNAIEAAITMGACLAVIYPHFTGFGGDSFMMIAAPDGDVKTLSGIGQCAAKVPAFGSAIPLRGPAAMLTTAATVDTLGQAHTMSTAQHAGNMSWEQLLKPAIRFAREGYPLSASQHFWYDFRRQDLPQMPGVRTTFGGADDGPATGACIKQPQLAASLELLAERGYRDFYDGKLAARIAAGLKDVGSPLTADDLSQTRARVEPPLRVTYRDGELLAHQPPTQGVTTLEIMGILNQFDLSGVAEGSADYYHLLVEAIKRAFNDRNRFLADPDHTDVPTRTLLSEDYLQRQAQSINREQALAWPDVFKPGDTVFMAATDASGLSVSLLQTIYFDWGSGVMAGDTGILWHNRGAAFSLDPAHPNAIAGGKRPFHTLNPGIYMRQGKPHLLYGTQGADGQPQTLSAILTRLIDYGMSPTEALAKPRFLLGRTFSDSRDSLKLEADAGAEVFDTLRSYGHEMSELPVKSPLAGHPGVIRIAEDTSLSGAHDPRSDGCALSLT